MSHCPGSVSVDEARLLSRTENAGQASGLNAPSLAWSLDRLIVVMFTVIIASSVPNPNHQDQSSVSRALAGLVCNLDGVVPGKISTGSTAVSKINDQFKSIGRNGL